MAYCVNTFYFCGRLVRDPEVRYKSDSLMCMARVTIALDRGKDKDGNDKGADFPQVVFFGKIAESIEKNCRKGMLVMIEGKVKTGSGLSERTQKKEYYTDLVGSNILYERARDQKAAQEDPYQDAPCAADITKDDTWSSQVPMGFLEDDDIPF